MSRGRWLTATWLLYVSRTASDGPPDVLGVECPRCGSPANRLCETARGDVAVEPHMARLKMMYEAQKARREAMAAG